MIYSFVLVQMIHPFLHKQISHVVDAQLLLLLLSFKKNTIRSIQAGLRVEPDWYNVMLKKFQLLLDTMAASDMPETAQYRIDVTKWANYVIKTVKENPNDPEAVEEAVQMGQVEELIEMADDEMIAMEAYLSVRMWELAEATNPQVNFNPDPMEDEMAEGGHADVQDAIREGIEKMKEEKKD